MSYLQSGRPQKDRLQGEFAEDLFMDFLRKKGRSATRTHGYAPDFDVWDDEYTYEVKYDRMSTSTGNFYIERKSLWASKAVYLVYLFQQPTGDPRVYFIAIAPCAKVRNYLRHHAAEMMTGGDFKEPGLLLNDTAFRTLFKGLGWISPLGGADS